MSHRALAAALALAAAVTSGLACQDQDLEGAQAFGFQGPGWVWPSGVAVDSSGAMYVYGTATGQVDLDPGPGTSMTGHELAALLLVRLGPEGRHDWSLTVPVPQG